MSRYLVIEVGCLECSYGDADANVVGRSESLDEAVRQAIKQDYSSQYDRFVIDTKTGNITSPNSDDKA